MNASSVKSLTIAAELPEAPALGERLVPAPASVRARVASRRRLGLGKALPYGWLLGPVLLVIYWAVGSAAGWIDTRILPSPWATAVAAVELVQQGRLQEHVAISSWRAAQGLTYGVITGVILALVSGLSLLGGYIFDGLVQVKRAIPTLALIPMFVLWFGIGETMKVTVIAFTVFIPIYVHTHNALRGIDLKHVELAETLRLSRLDFIRQVVLPGALPGMLLGLRFGVMGAWLALVVVEQLNATSGIGYMINLARNYAQSDIMLVGLVVYALLGVASDAAVRLLERKVLTWRRTLAK
jgi:sulfonate transport system permease protein